MTTKQAKPATPQSGPFICIMPDVIADAPVYETRQRAQDFADRCSEETAGNVRCLIYSVPQIERLEAERAEYEAALVLIRLRFKGAA